MKRILAVLCCLVTTAHAKPADLPTLGPVVNIVEWSGNQLPPVYERSDQLPLTRSDLAKLSDSRFKTEQLVQMITQRRYAGDVSADGLIALQTAGIAAETIQAASLHALAPNRSIDLSITLKIDGQRSQPRTRYLYVIIPDGEIERVFTADLNQVFGGRWTSDTTTDRSDLLIPRSVRTVSFTGRIPLTNVAPRELTVFTSPRPDIHWLSELDDTTRARARTHAFKYPASSLRSDCRLLIRLYQDRMLEDNWTITGTHFECEWD